MAEGENEKAETVEEQIAREIEPGHRSVSWNDIPSVRHYDVVTPNELTEHTRSDYWHRPPPKREPEEEYEVTVDEDGNVVQIPTPRSPSRRNSRQEEHESSARGRSTTGKPTASTAVEEDEDVEEIIEREDGRTADPAYRSISPEREPTVITPGADERNFPRSGSGGGFYQTPFFETVSDLAGDYDGLDIETPIIEAGERHGFVEGEVDETPTPAQTKGVFWDPSATEALPTASEMSRGMPGGFEELEDEDEDEGEDVGVGASRNAEAPPQNREEPPERDVGEDGSQPRRASVSKAPSDNVPTPIAKAKDLQYNPYADLAASTVSSARSAADDRDDEDKDDASIRRRERDRRKREKAERMTQNERDLLEHSEPATPATPTAKEDPFKYQVSNGSFTDLGAMGVAAAVGAIARGALSGRFSLREKGRDTVRDDEDAAKMPLPEGSEASYKEPSRSYTEESLDRKEKKKRDRDGDGKKPKRHSASDYVDELCEEATRTASPAQSEPGYKNPKGSRSRSKPERDDDAKSVVSEPPKSYYDDEPSSKSSRRKSKRNGDDDAASVSSVRFADDEPGRSSSKKDKERGGIVGLFRRDSDRVEEKEKARDEGEDEGEKKKKKKKHRSSETYDDDDDDTRSVHSSKSSSRRDRDDGNDDDARSVRSTRSSSRRDDDQADEDDEA
ncbi:hypothetical protein LTS18_009170, partial [Coniosporium uncinatum]